jgi:hypothetical protein
MKHRRMSFKGRLLKAVDCRDSILGEIKGIQADLFFVVLQLWQLHTG